MAAEDELLLPRLPELFETGKQLLDEVEVATEPAGSRIVQEKVFKGLDLLEKAAEMLSQLDLFRYKQKKELEHRLSAMKSAVESGQADDERVREYYHLHLQRWIDISLEEIESIDQEIKILRERDSSREASTSNSSRQERPPVKPFILTRNTAQAKVFGAGYPSLATMTVSDWYEQHRKYGALPDQGIAKATPEEFRKAAQQQEEQEEKEEEDDEQTLHRAREWDDWKDTHPRGYGNRQNMG
ncbi:immunoglobulin-binding protein 1 isoform X2 [Chlorocebus sabaeus]|uniref:immunoglobulin-binding protein 1 isoform X2 n=1 Tax=Chlorocebus sabaeus TaxID=60711 RepID=UPI0018B04D14|nr:immunoglobulin-binding protein 1 isoform X2 [Chlorocebus sabaeus]XP_045240419.1 immunoglobulin-binding protein 1 isoform X2 [Macaca fascicularis]